MIQEIRGELGIKRNQKFAIVGAEFNGLITTRLADAAVDALKRHGAADNQILKVWVPGSLEISVVARKLALSGKFSAVICLGCVIRGQTSHFDHVAEQAAAGIARIATETGIPAIFGIITADTVEQAMDRAGLKMGNAGWSAACAAIETAQVMGQLKRVGKKR
jgi:6,7-dimethyl-8-ribityllumazine synthase